ncbi:hypothetical protein CHS0354_005253, partial [Potamilus streckersoni]
MQTIAPTVCRNAYVEYVGDMIKDTSTSNKLYSFVKSKMCDGSGISPLKKDGRDQ